MQLPLAIFAVAATGDSVRAIHTRKTFLSAARVHLTEVFPMQEPAISYVTWSPKGIRVVYTGSMVAHLTAADIFPLAVPAKVVSLVASERRDMVRKAS